MAQPSTNKCKNIMLGHAVADDCRISTYLAIQLSKSLRKTKRFDASDIMARYLYVYHTSQTEMSASTKLVYEELKASLPKQPETFKREHFYFPVDTIYNASQIAHDKLKGLSGGCNPAQRSFPLALCPWITDENLFQYSCAEARLTHYSSTAGQVAGVSNLICRYLLNGMSWSDATKTAFSITTNLLGEIQEIEKHFSLDEYIKPSKHPAYGPSTLYTSLFCVSQANSFENAIMLATKKESEYCIPIVGILAAARWPVQKTSTNRCQTYILERIDDVSSDFNDEWEKINRKKPKQ